MMEVSGDVAGLGGGGGLFWHISGGVAAKVWLPSAMIHIEPVTENIYSRLQCPAKI